MFSYKDPETGKWEPIENLKKEKTMDKNQLLRIWKKLVKVDKALECKHSDGKPICYACWYESITNVEAVIKKLEKEINKDE